MHLRLDRTDVLSIRKAHGTRITVLAGIAWITEPGSSDHFLGAGQSYQIGSNGPVLIESQSRGVVDLQIDPARL